MDTILVLLPVTISERVRVDGRECRQGLLQQIIPGEEPTQGRFKAADTFC